MVMHPLVQLEVATQLCIHIAVRADASATHFLVRALEHRRNHR